jgi:hypothetical protein
MEAINDDVNFEKYNFESENKICKEEPVLLDDQLYQPKNDIKEEINEISLGEDQNQVN